MRVTCHGCGLAFKRSGLAHHLRQSENPQCHILNPRRQSDHDSGAQEPLADVPPTPVSGAAEPDVQSSDSPQEHFPPTMDPAGDLFGDYSGYIATDFGFDNTEDQDAEEDDQDSPQVADIECYGSTGPSG